MQKIQVFSRFSILALKLGDNPILCGMLCISPMNYICKKIIVSQSVFSIHLLIVYSQGSIQDTAFLDNQRLVPGYNVSRSLEVMFQDTAFLDNQRLVPGYNVSRSLEVSSRMQRSQINRDQFQDTSFLDLLFQNLAFLNHRKLVPVQCSVYNLQFMLYNVHCTICTESII